jgi:hypothetical protein
MKPLQQPYREIFKHTRIIRAEGGERVRIPILEMALVMKFSAMTSLYRADEDKFLDAHDFISMVKANPEIDRDLLTELACLVYAEAGKDLLEMIRKVEAGEQLRI